MWNSTLWCRWRPNDGGIGWQTVLYQRWRRASCLHLQARKDHDSSVWRPHSWFPPKKCSFPPKHTVSLPTWTNVNINCRQTSNLKHWRLSSTSPTLPSHYLGSTLPVFISAMLHSHLSQGHNCRTGRSRQRVTARQRSAVPSANLEGKCKEELEERRIKEGGWRIYRERSRNRKGTNVMGEDTNKK